MTQLIINVRFLALTLFLRASRSDEYRDLWKIHNVLIPGTAQSLSDEKKIQFKNSNSKFIFYTFQHGHVTPTTYASKKTGHELLKKPHKNKKAQAYNSKMKRDIVTWRFTFKSALKYWNFLNFSSRAFKSPHSSEPIVQKYLLPKNKNGKSEKRTDMSRATRFPGIKKIFDHCY